VSYKIAFLEKIDAHSGTYVELASESRLQVCTSSKILNNCDEAEGSYIQCRPFFRQRKSLKDLPLQQLESAYAAWFKQVCASIVCVGSTVFRKNALHAAGCMGGDSFLDSSDWIDGFNGDMSLFMEL
jgi:hypothetical protein